MNGQFHVNAERSLLRQTAAPNEATRIAGPESTLEQVADAIADMHAAAYVPPCTCHPDDNPPVPCARKYAFSDCKAAALPIALLSADPDFEVVDGPLFRLMREIADEACRVDIECHARFVGDGASGPVYDTNQLEPGHIDDPEMVAADKRAIERAVQYLDMRGILHRPVAGYPSLVCFARV